MIICKKEDFYNLIEFIFFKSGLFLLAIVFPFMDIMPHFVKLLLLMILIVNFFFKLYFYKKIKINDFALIVLFFMILMFLSDIGNFKLILYFILFFIAYNLLDKEKDINLFIKTSLLAIMFLSFMVILQLFGIFDFFYFHKYSSGIIRLWGFSESSNPNDFALLFTIPFPFLFYFYKKSRKKSIILFFIIIVFFDLLVTQSKAAIIPIVLLLPLMIFDMKKYKKKIIASYIILLIFLIILIPVLKTNNYTKRILFMEKGYRNLIWKASIDLFLEEPFGYYNNKNIKQLIYNKIVYDYNKYIDKPKFTHNLFLGILLQVGIIGFFVLLLIIYYLFKRSIKYSLYDTVFIYYAIGFFIYFFYNLLHFGFGWYYFWMFLGVWNANVSLIENRIYVNE